MNPRLALESQCHLWKKIPDSTKEIVSNLKLIQVYQKEVHLEHFLMQCSHCGQLYFHEFYEVIDWKEGKDGQYQLWIPVEDEESARELASFSPLKLAGYPSIRVDLVLGTIVPTLPYFHNNP